MRTLSKDENANLQLTVKGNIATVTHTAKVNRDDEARVEMTWNLDFEKVSKDDLLKLAARTVTIKQQAAWRKAADRMKAEKWDNVTFDVAAILAAGRQPADPKARAITAISKLSKAEREEVLKALQG